MSEERAGILAQRGGCLALSGGKWILDFEARPGDKVDLSAINEWAYLSNLIQRYNAIVGKTHSQHLLAKGKRIVELRNALAHGIIIARSPQPLLRLLKFGKARGSKAQAKVEFTAEMTEDWLREQRGIIRESIETVFQYLKAAKISQPYSVSLRLADHQPIFRSHLAARRSHISGLG